MCYFCLGEFAFCDGVSQNCFVFDLSTPTFDGSLAEMLFVNDIDRLKADLTKWIDG